MRLFKTPGEADGQDNAVAGSQWLAWLADAPMFIDSQLVASIYDAVIRPEFRTEQVTIGEANSTILRGGVSIQAGGALKFLIDLFPSLSVSASADAGAQHQTDKTSEIILTPVDNPFRQLVHLALHYTVNQEERVAVVGNRDATEELGELSADPPRAMTALDLTPRSILLPMAFETEGGAIRTLYQDLRGAGAVEYKVDASREQKRAYWSALAESFDPQATMVALERAVSKEGGRVEWIDYRLGLVDESLQPTGDSVHLHLVARGAYATGTFAYQFIKRGYRHGIRVVGLLKSGPAINVLAVFER